MNDSTHKKYLTEGTELNTPGASGALLTGTTLEYGVHDMSRSYKLQLNK